MNIKHSTMFTSFKPDVLFINSRLSSLQTHQLKLNL